MSIYSINQLMDKVQKSSEEELRAMLSRILKLRLSETMQIHLARIIMDVEIIDGRKSHCMISQRRVIPYSQMKALNESPIMAHVDHIIAAALVDGGPFNTTDILMRAASVAGGKAFYITATGISKTHKMMAGYILTMAGFERRSHFNRETKQPIKAWKLKGGGPKLSVQQRAELVRSTIRQELNHRGESPKIEAPVPPLSAEDLI